MDRQKPTPAYHLAKEAARSAVSAASGLKKEEVTLGAKPKYNKDTIVSRYLARRAEKKAALPYSHYIKGPVVRPFPKLPPAPHLKRQSLLSSDEAFQAEVKSRVKALQAKDTLLRSEAPDLFSDRYKPTMVSPLDVRLKKKEAAAREQFEQVKQSISDVGSRKRDRSALSAVVQGQASKVRRMQEEHRLNEQRKKDAAASLRRYEMHTQTQRVDDFLDDGKYLSLVGGNYRRYQSDSKNAYAQAYNNLVGGTHPDQRRSVYSSLRDKKFDYDPVTGGIRLPARDTWRGTRTEYLLPNGIILNRSDHERLKRRTTSGGQYKPDVSLASELVPVRKFDGTFRYKDREGNQYTPEEVSRMVAAERYANKRSTKIKQGVKAAYAKYNKYREQAKTYTDPIQAVLATMQDLHSLYEATKNAKENAGRTRDAWSRFFDTVGSSERKGATPWSIDPQSVFNSYRAGLNAMDQTAALIDSFTNPINSSVTRWFGPQTGAAGHLLNPTQYYWQGRQIIGDVDKMIGATMGEDNDGKFDYNQFRGSIIDALVTAGRMTKYGEAIQLYEELTGRRAGDLLNGVAGAAEDLGVTIAKGFKDLWNDDTTSNTWSDFGKRMEERWASVVDVGKEMPERFFSNIVPVIPAYNSVTNMIDWVRSHPTIERWIQEGGQAARDALYSIADTPGSVFRSILDGRPDPTDPDPLQRRVLEKIEYALSHMSEEQAQRLLGENGINESEFDTIAEDAVRDYFYNYLHGGYSDEQVQSFYEEGKRNSGSINSSYRQRILEVANAALKTWKVATDKYLSGRKTDMDWIRNYFTDITADQIVERAQAIHWALQHGELFPGEPLSPHFRAYLEAIEPMFTNLSSVFGSLANMSATGQKDAIERALAGLSEDSPERAYLLAYLNALNKVDPAPRPVDGDGLSPEPQPFQGYDGTAMDNAFDKFYSGNATQEDRNRYLRMQQENAIYAALQAGTYDSYEQARLDGIQTAYMHLATYNHDDRASIALQAANDETAPAYLRAWYEHYRTVGDAYQTYVSLQGKGVQHPNPPSAEEIETNAVST